MLFIGSEGREGRCGLCPSTESCHTCRKRKSDIPAKKSDRRGWPILTVELENQLNECETEIGAGTITSYDDIGSGYWFVEGFWPWIEKRKICYENIEQSSRKGMLRGKAIADRNASTLSQLGQPADGRSKAGRIATTKKLGKYP